MTLPLSLVMIARDEAHDLPACLASVKGLAAETVLVDSGSTDATVETAKTLGAKVVFREFDSYSGQKNYALSLASNDWVLHLDPDETLSPELKAEITELLAAAPAQDAFEIPYENYFLGRRMEHCGLGAEKHIRLFKKSKAAFGGGLVHEGIRINGSTGRLAGRIIHRSYPDMQEYLRKFNIYTTLAAQKLHAAGKKFSWFKIMCVPLEFIKRYVLRLGFLDGFPGLVWSAASAFYVFVKYAKLYQLERGGEK